MIKRLQKPSTFVFGLVFGALVGLIAWYWYKSTSAEEGALNLLDKMAQVDARIRQLETMPQPEPELVENYITLEPVTSSLPPFLETVDVEDLQRVKGIGPVFAGRLQAAGIDTMAALTAVSPTTLADILNISDGRAEDILAEAQRLQ